MLTWFTCVHGTGSTSLQSLRGPLESSLFTLLQPLLALTQLDKMVKNIHAEYESPSILS